MFSVIPVMIALLLICTGKPGYASQEKSQPKVSVKSLDKEYRDWLDLVDYIITPTERGIFLKLTNNKDRTGFIDLFWKMRDPTKGTPENEFKDEHIKRFEHANRYFKYGSPIPGWKTDRGRIYIILGPPVTENEVIQNGLVPVLIWEYYGGPSKGLPTMFRVVFYKRTETDYYRLYVPSVDGPASLLRVESGSIDANDNEALYKKILEFNNSVAEVCLTLIPGESLYSYTPSIESNMMLSRIQELPQKSINTTYARNYLNYKGIVETSVTTDYITVNGDAYLFKDPFLNLNFVHFSVLPSRMSVDYSPEADKYYLNYNLMVILKKGDDIVFQYSRDFPLYYSKAELESDVSNGVVIADFFPVIEGEYLLIGVLQNSVSKEISYYERKLNVPPPNAQHPCILGPITSYLETSTAQQMKSAFNIVGRMIKTDPKRVYGLKDTVYGFFWVERNDYTQNMTAQLDVICTDERRPYKKSYKFPISQDNKIDFIQQQFETLNYGNYTIKITLFDNDGKILDSKDKDFEISPNSYVPHPPIVSKSIKPDFQFLFYSMIANQYDNIANTERSISFYEKAFAMNNTYPELIKSYAGVLMKQKKYDQIITIIENLKAQPKEAFSYFSLLGKALYGMGKYSDSLDALLNANKIYDSDFTLLNQIGLCCLRLNNKEEAIKAFTASLKINDKQDEIQKILDQLRSEKN